MSTHQEKQRIFDEYAKSNGFDCWIGLQSTCDPIILKRHIFRVCDLVQEEQQKRIADSARMNFHDGYWKTNNIRKYFQSGADNLTVDKSSIINPENKIM